MEHPLCMRNESFSCSCLPNRNRKVRVIIMALSNMGHWNSTILIKLLLYMVSCNTFKKWKMESWNIKAERGSINSFGQCKLKNHLRRKFGFFYLAIYSSTVGHKYNIPKGGNISFKIQKHVSHLKSSALQYIKCL